MRQAFLLSKKTAKNIFRTLKNSVKNIHLLTCLCGNVEQMIEMLKSRIDEGGAMKFRKKTPPVRQVLLCTALLIALFGQDRPWRRPPVKRCRRLRF